MSRLPLPGTDAVCQLREKFNGKGWPYGQPDCTVYQPEEIHKERLMKTTEKQMAAKIQKLEDLAIPEDFDYDRVAGLTIECRQKLKRYAPRTIAQASRISGVSPADISVLLVYFGR